MSTRPVNPLDEALRLASQSLMFRGLTPGHGPTNTDASLIKALAAQALATVALVEEQRTANLIALATCGRCPLGVEPHFILAQAARRMGLT